jgi:hypothetical protein
VKAAEETVLAPTSESRLGWFYYLFAPLAMLFAIALFVALLFTGLKSIERSLTRVIVPGKTRVQLAKPGWYAIFYEYRSEVGGRTFNSSEQAPAMQCNLAHAGTGEKVALRRPATNANYRMTRFAGYSVLGFQSDAGGDYDFSCDFQPGYSGEPVVMAMGTGVTAQIFKMVISGLAALLLGACATGLIFAGVYRERNPRKRRIYALPTGPWPPSS